MAIPYRQFAIWVLSDLATRESHDDRITFTGNHVCAQYLPPLRLEGETAEQFAFRLDRFRKNLPRHSDATERLAIAVRALMLDGEKSFAAAHSVLKILREVPAEKKAEYEKQGIGYAFRPIDMPIGKTRRNHRTKEKKQDKTPEELQVDTIRTQVARFISNHRDFERVFQMRLGSFRYERCRDADWFASAEASYAARVEAFEQSSEPFDWYRAMPLAVSAQFYHEQRKYTPALLHYRKAIRAARRAVMHENLRAFVLQWLRRGVKLCNHSAKMIPMPSYGGPWLPGNSLE
jgi:hypothetical protein